jgi:hypothetical protein
MRVLSILEADLFRGKYFYKIIFIGAAYEGWA